MILTSRKDLPRKIIAGGNRNGHEQGRGQEHRNQD